MPSTDPNDLGTVRPDLSGPLPRMITTTWDGIRIAWDTCASCLRHMVNCLHELPVEPEYLKREHVAPAERPRFQTTVYGGNTSENPNKFLGSPIVSKGPLSLGDLVDDELVAKVKAAKEEHDDKSA